ncbi:MAG TPA: hypothetical protein VNY74_13115 [Edaphobacter sp.]|nr:hypothetical protein [Edaphobacter sp.]
MNPKYATQIEFFSHPFLCRLRTIPCLLLSCIVFLAGCVPNRPYRLGSPPPTPEGQQVSKAPEYANARQYPKAQKFPSIVRRSQNSTEKRNYDLAYIEFDDMGEFWTIGNLGTSHANANSQLEAAVDLIEERKRTMPVAVVAFIHGWKNNASEYDETHKNLEGFKDQLQLLAEHDQLHSYIGVFLSWRGQSLPGDLFFSYWNRRDAARRVGGASMTEAIFRLMFVTKPPVPPSPTDRDQCGAVNSPASLEAANKPRDLFVLIGHSFGVRILERAISQPLMALLYERRSEADICRKAYDDLHKDNPLKVITFESPADLIVTINAANDAFEAKAMIEGMQRMNLRTCIGDTCNAQGEYFDSPPVIVSILSKGDWITRKLMPVAQAISYPSQKLNRKYDENAYEEGQLVDVKQHSFFLHNEGSIQQLVSHTVATCTPETPCVPCPEGLMFKGKTTQYELIPVWIDPATCKKITPPATQDSSGAKPDPSSQRRFVNKTPFWVFMVPESVIPGHTEINTEAASALVQAIVFSQATSGKKSISIALPTTQTPDPPQPKP